MEFFYLANSFLTFCSVSSLPARLLVTLFELWNKRDASAQNSHVLRSGFVKYLLQSPQGVAFVAGRKVYSEDIKDTD